MEKIKVYYLRCGCGSVIQSHDQGLSALCSDCKEYFKVITDETELAEAKKKFEE